MHEQWHRRLERRRVEGVGDPDAELGREQRPDRGIDGDAIRHEQA